MKRSDLIDILKRAAPALGAKDLVPAFSCFFFNEGAVTAYDDIVAIQTPCNIDKAVTGGLRGKLLMDFLNASRAPDAEFIIEEKICIAKAGRAKMSIPLLPMEDLLLEWPKDKGNFFDVSDNFMLALTAANASIGLDPSVPWRMGITAVFSKKGVLFYSTDNYGVTQSEAEVKGPEGLSTILPPRFCELIIAKGKPETLGVTKNWVEAKYADGTRIFSRTMTDVKAESFAGMIDQVKWDSGFHELPKGLSGALDRMLVVLDGADEPYCDMTAKEDRLRFFAKGPIGEAKDFCKLPGHAEAEVKVRPNLLQRAIPHANSIRLIPDKCVAFVGDQYRHMVSLVSS